MLSPSQYLTPDRGRARGGDAGLRDGVLSPRGPHQLFGLGPGDDQGGLRSDRSLRALPHPAHRVRRRRTGTARPWAEDYTAISSFLMSFGPLLSAAINLLANPYLGSSDQQLFSISLIIHIISSVSQHATTQSQQFRVLHVHFQVLKDHHLMPVFTFVIFQCVHNSILFSRQQVGGWRKCLSIYPRKLFVQSMKHYVICISLPFVGYCLILTVIQCLV